MRRFALCLALAGFAWGGSSLLARWRRITIWAARPTAVPEDAVCNRLRRDHARAARIEGISPQRTQRPQRTME